MGEPPTIDDKLISVSYYRMPLTAGQTGVSGGVPMAANALAAAQWNCQGQQKSNEEIERLAEYSGLTCIHIFEATQMTLNNLISHFCFNS